MHIFEAPKTLDSSRLDSLIELFNAIRSSKEGRAKVVIDWEKTEEILPSGRAILCCLKDSIVEQQTLITHKNISTSIKNDISFRMLMEQRKTLASPSSYNQAGSDFFLRGVGNAYSPVSPDMLEPFFEGAVDDGLLYQLCLLVNELTQNAVDHSTAERYFFFFSKTEKHAEIGVLDMGVTIPAKMEQKYVCENDLAYLSKALELHVGTRRERPGGLGLNHLFEILKDHEGTLILLSRGAQLRRYFKVRKTEKRELNPSLHGTWCFARFPLG